MCTHLCISMAIVNISKSVSCGKFGSSFQARYFAFVCSSAQHKIRCSCKVNNASRYKQSQTCQPIWCQYPNFLQQASRHTSIFSRRAIGHWSMRVPSRLCSTNPVHHEVHGQQEPKELRTTLGALSCITTSNTCNNICKDT